MTERISRDQCCGLLVDVQEFFLKSLSSSSRAEIERHTAAFTLLFRYLRLPLVATVERPLAHKGGLPAIVSDSGSKFGTLEIFEKNFFDLTKESAIADRLRALGRKQIVLAGCETDVCILQSCLGLLNLGYRVFVVEDLLFSSSPQVDSALRRMRQAGAIPLSFKTLFHELLESVEGSPFREKIAEECGPEPSELTNFRFR